jgi:hypothetical protein
MSSTEVLELAVSTRQVLDGVWTIRHNKTQPTFYLYIELSLPEIALRVEDFHHNTTITHSN